LTGEIQRIKTDIEVDGRLVKGNPQFRLITTKGKFETRWGDKFFQVKRGQLKLELPKNPQIIPTQLNNIYNLEDIDIYNSWKQDENYHDLHPWMMHRHNNDEERVTNVTIVQNGHRPTSLSDPKDLHFGGRRRAGSSPDCIRGISSQIYQSVYKPKPEINVIKNGSYMDELLNCRNIEAMNNLLKIDLEEWIATFTDGALDMSVTFLSEALHLKYHKPKFEYLWAQLQDESPILMSLCSLSYDDQHHQLYFPL